MNGRLFGVDILDVKEVTAETAFTNVAHAPEEVLGLVNIRGHIYLALDLHRLLGLPAAAVTADSRLVLFKPAVGNAFGVMVDAISDIQTVDANRTESFSRADPEAAVAGAGRVDLIDCVCELDSELLVVLNPRRFLAVIEQSLSVTT
jgi:purine-binding chemotaxis protein CheW